MPLSRKIDKKTITTLFQENKRLKRENQRLHESFNDLQRYIDEYKGLNEELNQMKETYAAKMKDFDELEEEYRKELKKLQNNK